MKEREIRTLPKELGEYIPGFFDKPESDYLLDFFIKNIAWNHEMRRMYGRDIMTPRLTAWYGDLATNPTGTKLIDANPWIKELLDVKAKVEPLAGVHFNSILLNYYRDGRDSVDWHDDNEPLLGKNPVIASLSFGETRVFDIRNKEDHKDKYAIPLEHGSLLLMTARLQNQWHHRIAKTALPVKPRVNLTLRTVIPV